VFFSVRSTVRRPLRKLGLALFLALSASTGTGVLAKAPSNDSGTALGSTVQIDQLPGDARNTLALIQQGGPFPHSKDGVVFHNRERLLPAQAGSYYREYTVNTPGARNRGARRIVCGGRQPTTPDACFYTADHYTSFRRIVQ